MSGQMNVGTETFIKELNLVTGVYTPKYTFPWAQTGYTISHVNAADASPRDYIIYAQIGLQLQGESGYRLFLARCSLTKYRAMVIDWMTGLVQKILSRSGMWHG